MVSPTSQRASWAFCHSTDYRLQFCWLPANAEPPAAVDAEQKQTAPEQASPPSIAAESAKAGNAPQEEIGVSAKVIGVYDADTITVLLDDKSQLKIRFNAIDAPERAQAFGNKAKQALAGLIAGKQVRIVSDEVDKYGRTLGDVFLNGESVNLWLVQNGWA